MMYLQAKKNKFVFERVYSRPTKVSATKISTWSETLKKIKRMDVAHSLLRTSKDVASISIRENNTVDLLINLEECEENSHLINTGHENMFNGRHSINIEHKTNYNGRVYNKVRGVQMPQYSDHHIPETDFPNVKFNDIQTQDLNRNYGANLDEMEDLMDTSYEFMSYCHQKKIFDDLETFCVQWSENELPENHKKTLLRICKNDCKKMKNKTNTRTSLFNGRISKVKSCDCFNCYKNNKQSSAVPKSDEANHKTLQNNNRNFTSKYYHKKFKGYQNVSCHAGYQMNDLLHPTTSNNNKSYNDFKNYPVYENGSKINFNCERKTLDTMHINAKINVDRTVQENPFIKKLCTPEEMENEIVHSDRFQHMNGNNNVSTSVSNRKIDFYNSIPVPLVKTTNSFVNFNEEFTWPKYRDKNLNISQDFTFHDINYESKPQTASQIEPRTDGMSNLFKTELKVSRKSSSNSCHSQSKSIYNGFGNKNEKSIPGGISLYPEIRKTSTLETLCGSEIEKESEISNESYITPYNSMLRDKCIVTNSNMQDSTVFNLTEESYQTMFAPCNYDEETSEIHVDPFSNTLKIIKDKQNCFDYGQNLNETARNISSNNFNFQNYVQDVGKQYVSTESDSSNIADIKYNKVKMCDRLLTLPINQNMKTTVHNEDLKKCNNSVFILEDKLLDGIHLGNYNNLKLNAKDSKKYPVYKSGVSRDKMSQSQNDNDNEAASVFKNKEEGRSNNGFALIHSNKRTENCIKRILSEEIALSSKIKSNVLSERNSFLKSRPSLRIIKIENTDTPINVSNNFKDELENESLETVPASFTRNVLGEICPGKNEMNNLIDNNINHKKTNRNPIADGSTSREMCKGFCQDNVKRQSNKTHLLHNDNKLHDTGNFAARKSFTKFVNQPVNNNILDSSRNPPLEEKRDSPAVVERTRQLNKLTKNLLKIYQNCPEPCYEYVLGKSREKLTPPQNGNGKLNDNIKFKNIQQLEIKKDRNISNCSQMKYQRIQGKNSRYNKPSSVISRRKKHNLAGNIKSRENGSCSRGETNFSDNHYDKVEYQDQKIYVNKTLKANNIIKKTGIIINQDQISRTKETDVNNNDPSLIRNLHSPQICPGESGANNYYNDHINLDKSNKIVNKKAISERFSYETISNLSETDVGYSNYVSNKGGNRIKYPNKAIKFKKQPKSTNTKRENTREKFSSSIFSVTDFSDCENYYHSSGGLSSKSENYKHKEKTTADLMEQLVRLNNYIVQILQNTSTTNSDNHKLSEIERRVDTFGSMYMPKRNKPFKRKSNQDSDKNSDSKSSVSSLYRTAVCRKMKYFKARKKITKSKENLSGQSTYLLSNANKHLKNEKSNESIAQAPSESNPQKLILHLQEIHEIVKRVEKRQKAIENLLLVDKCGLLYTLNDNTS